MRPARVGVLGTGTVVRGYHLPALVANPRARVTALGNLHPASLAELAAQYGITKTYADFDRMARDPEIDAVLIALPNFLHAPVTLTMLQCGKHVLCEKPMAMTAAEARRMAGAADAEGRKLMIAHVWRFSPETHWLRALLDGGKLGTVLTVKGHAVVAGRGPQPESWFVRPETAGGGALADVGIHAIDTISFLFRDRLRPMRVSARIVNRFRPLEVEDTASARIEYDNGIVAEIEAGWYHNHAPCPHGAIEVFGTHGSVRTLPARWTPASGADAIELTPEIASKHPDDDRALYAAQIDHFLDCILEDIQPVCDGWQGLADMIVLEAAYQAAHGQSAVRLESETSTPHNR